MKVGTLIPQNESVCIRSIRVNPCSLFCMTYQKVRAKGMNDNELTERFTDVLQNIEFAIHAVYRRRPELTDYEVGRALEAAIRRYKDEARRRQPKERQLSGLVEEVYAAIESMTEYRLGRRPLAKGAPTIPPGELSVEDLLACLQRIHKSVGFWSKQGGRQGYLTYVGEFLGH